MRRNRARRRPAATTARRRPRRIGKLVRGVERGGRHWTAARRKDSLQRVLEGSRSDAKRLQQRLTQLAASWDSDSPDGAVETEPAPLDELPPAADAPAPAAIEAPIALNLGADERPGAASSTRWAAPRARRCRRRTNRPSCRTHSPRWSNASAARAPRRRWPTSWKRCAAAPASCCSTAITSSTSSARCAEELTASLTDLAEDDSWAQGQCDAMRVKLDEGLTARGVRAVSELLRDTRERQGTRAPSARRRASRSRR